jgi:hypothetical protein
MKKTKTRIIYTALFVAASTGILFVYQHLASRHLPSATPSESSELTISAPRSDVKEGEKQDNRRTDRPGSSAKEIEVAMPEIGLGEDGVSPVLTEENLWLPIDSENISIDVVRDILDPHYGEDVRRDINRQQWEQFVESVFYELKSHLVNDMDSYMAVKAGRVMLWRNEEIDKEKLPNGYQQDGPILQAMIGFADDPIKVYVGVPENFLSKKQIEDFSDGIRKRFFGQEMVFVRLRTARKFYIPLPMFGDTPYVTFETWFFYDKKNMKPVFSALCENLRPAYAPNVDIPIFLREGIIP